jgi:mitochondrial intermediate peptidase
MIKTSLCMARQRTRSIAAACKPIPGPNVSISLTASVSTRVAKTLTTNYSRSFGIGAIHTTTTTTTSATSTSASAMATSMSIFWKKNAHVRYMSTHKHIEALTPTQAVVPTYSMLSAPDTPAWFQPRLMPSSCTHADSKRYSHEGTGMFGIHGLHEPSDLIRWAGTTREFAARHVEKIVNATSPTIESLLLLDEVSDLFSRMLDTAELCRNVIPDSEWVRAADDAYEVLHPFMERLNMNTELYGVVRKMYDDTSFCNSLTDEQRNVLKSVCLEFEHSGIALSEEKRTKLTQLRSEIQNIETTFARNATQARAIATIPSHLVRELDRVPRADSFQQMPSPSEAGAVSLVITPDVLGTVLKWSPSEDLRRIVYEAADTAAAANIPVLDALIARRQELADVLECRSYAHLAIDDQKMAKSPEKVRAFLVDFAERLLPIAREQVSMIRSFKASRTMHPSVSSDRVNPWDFGFYTGMMKSMQHKLDGRIIAEYFSVANCFRGFDLLARSLYNCTLVATEFSDNEDWAPDSPTHRFEVRDLSDNSVLGIIYFDLHDRPGKIHGGCTFTLQGSRSVVDMFTFESLGDQMPIVTVTCSFPGDTYSPMSQSDAETLFHEFGHAMHAIFSRTSLQTMSGIRGPFDFVEIPSHLMEYFVWDERVLQQFALHRTTGEPIPPDMISNLRDSKSMFAAYDACSLLMHAMLDITLFGPRELWQDRTTTELYCELSESIGLLNRAPNTSMHGSFTHFCHYGASYYAYPFSRIFSSHMWSRLFVQDPLSREAGERYRNEFLRYGSSKDPYTVVQSILGEAPSPKFLIQEFGQQSESSE